MDALILVDLQNDFMPGGALPVAGGDELVPLANALMDYFTLIVATQDWHPDSHGSFAVNHPGRQIGEVIELGGLPQILWPVHCVQGTPGADFHRELRVERISRVFKGIDSEVDSYSGFWDNGRRRSTGLADWLRGQGVAAVYICGLATDYCVRATALDAAAEGFRTFLIADACRGVELRPGDVARATEEMKAAGVRIINSEEITRQSRR